MQSSDGRFIQWNLPYDVALDLLRWLELSAGSALDLAKAGGGLAIKGEEETVKALITCASRLRNAMLDLGVMVMAQHAEGCPECAAAHNAAMEEAAHEGQDPKGVLWAALDANIAPLPAFLAMCAIGQGARSPEEVGITHRPVRHERGLQ